MKLSKKCKIEKLLGNAKSCSQAWLDVETRTLTATDGHALVRVPVHVNEADRTGWVSADALKQARKNEIFCGEDIIRLGEGRFITRLATYLEQPPPYEKVIPEKKEGLVVGVMLDPYLLGRVAEAFGLVGGFIIQATSNREALLLEVHEEFRKKCGAYEYFSEEDGAHPIALIMPVVVKKK